MRLETFKVSNFRSIEKVEIKFPLNKPVVIFGPNNVGKSNILKALDYFLGERYASYVDYQDSDFHLRDKDDFPNISFTGTFDEVFYSKIYKGIPINLKRICFTTNYEAGDRNEHTYHEENAGKIYLSNEDREKSQFILIDASRDMGRQLSYFSQYSVLSKMAKKMHGVLVSQTKSQLDDHFKNIKDTFESVPQYKAFHDRLQSSFESNINGFEHKLEIDLSAYDPNNYFNSLRIIAKEGEQVRAFDEFGTGEQQILLMSFVKAYAETFKGQNFILGIEEPEAHLHPLAQKWLAKNINAIAKSGLQVIITTHSPEFLDIENLEGFVKAYKEEGLTKVIQNKADSLAEACTNLGANSLIVNERSVLPFYKVNTFYDQLKAFFARKIILVEGPTEVFALPNYFKNFGYDLIKNGVEIIDCRGKSQIARNHRLFKAYGYECFCLFDADSQNDEALRGNEELGTIFSFDPQSMNRKPESFTYDPDEQYGYFGVDFENYMKKKISDYSSQEDLIEGRKVLKAKVISENNPNFKPDFIINIADSLELERNEQTSPSEELNGPEDINPDEIPF